MEVPVPDSADSINVTDGNIADHKVNCNKRNLLKELIYKVNRRDIVDRRYTSV